MTDPERQAVRQEKALPLLKALYIWATDMRQQSMPSGKLGDALQYLLAQWPKLIVTVR